MHFFQTKDGAKHRKRYLGLNPPFDLNVHIRVQHGLCTYAGAPSRMQLHLLPPAWKAKKSPPAPAQMQIFAGVHLPYIYIHARMQLATAGAPIGAVAIAFQHDPPGGLASRCTCVGAPNFAPKPLRSWGLQVHLCSIGALGAPA